MNCRFCSAPLTHIFVDLINAPASNSFLKADMLNEYEIFYPLKVWVCDKCFLVQLDEFKKHAEIFNDQYAYFSSYSSAWIKHAGEYVNMIVKRLSLNQNSTVFEIASNDGYLLQFFKQAKIPCIGIEPTSNTAKVSRDKGIETIEDFFNVELALKFKEKDLLADLIVGNNVLAHDPNLNSFVGGLKILLKNNGVITLEFPHLLQLIINNQFDTIYHEHFSYFSLLTLQNIFKLHGLEIFDVEELPTHGGSLRIYAKHPEDNSKTICDSVNLILEKEFSYKMNQIEGYKNFQVVVNRLKYEFLDLLINLKKNNKNIVAYGAAAKGNTLLNFCGIKNDLISFVVDKSPHKQGLFLPGSHIPIVDETEIKKNKPDFIIIFPWNIKDEIIEQLSYIRSWGAKFIIPIPKTEVI